MNPAEYVSIVVRRHSTGHSCVLCTITLLDDGV